MTDLALKVENLSKLYRIGSRQQSYKTLRDTLTHVMYAPIRRIRSTLGYSSSVVRPRSSGVCNDTIWALKDVSFEIKPGEVVGIIGRNGAGKTTLLKILSRITEPTEGYAQIYGRVGSLLEVGTGFHPELTGRENIYLNGAILGMKRVEIERKFDEIVDFSGMERFIDTPTKYFSSGMQVRLAFSIAAHLEPEILLVDEVLAVGDAEFQKKCIGKMHSVTEEGRTVLFVSHNMTAIHNLCSRTILIDNGKLILDGHTEYVINKYLDQNLAEGAIVTCKELDGKVEGVIRKYDPSIQFKEIAITDQKAIPCNAFHSDEGLRVSVTYECLTVVNDLRVIVQIVDDENRAILTTQNIDDSDEESLYWKNPGIYRSFCTIPPNTFGEKRFYISVQLENPKVEHLIINKILGFDIQFVGYQNIHGAHWNSFLRPRLSWETQVLEVKEETIA
ncbi:MAG: polysaccharide ABC transporter ATP-binding protein [Thermodesulfobacteriota bacterium]